MIDTLETKADLRRFIQGVVREPGAIQPHEIVGLDVVAEPASPTFATGWSDLGGGYASAGYYLDRGRVYFGGSVKNGGTGAGTIFTLPTGYRPSATVFFACPIFGGTGYVTIDSAGVVTDTTFSAGSKALTSLDSISFRAG